MKGSGSYPSNWREIAYRVKDAAHWRCIRCGHQHDPGSGYCLTVHHLDGNKANSSWWNLLALCQRCHLRIQGTVFLAQGWMFSHSAWIRIYLAGYFASRMGGDLTREQVGEQMDWLLHIGREGMSHGSGAQSGAIGGHQSGQSQGG